MMREDVMNLGSDEQGMATLRLDIWLWAARFYKTRSLAKQAIVTGKVDVGGQRAKSSRAVRVGDVLAITRGDDTYEIEVRGLSDQRGPAPFHRGGEGHRDAGGFRPCGRDLLHRP